MGCLIASVLPVDHHRHEAHGEYVAMRGSRSRLIPCSNADAENGARQNGNHEPWRFGLPRLQELRESNRVQR